MYMSKKKCKKKCSASRAPHKMPFPLRLKNLKKGEFARLLSACPNGVKEVVNLDGILGVVDGKKVDLPTDANEFLLEINSRTPTAGITLDYFLNEMSTKYGARIFMAMTGTAFFIVTELSWNEATKLFQQCMSMFGLWPFN